MRRVVGYEGEGRVKRPVWSDNEPAVGRDHNIMSSSSHGVRSIGGEIVRGENERDRANRLQREHKARKRALR